MDLNLIVDRILDWLAPLSAHRYAYLKSAIAQFPAFICVMDFDRDEPIEYDVTIGHGSSIYHLQLIMVNGKGDAESAYRRLNTFVSYPNAESVKERLEEIDPTLGGACDSLILLNGSKFGTQEFSGGYYLGGRWLIDVQA